MFDIFQEDQGLVQRLKELKDYYKQKDTHKGEKQEKENKTVDSILKKVLKIYPGM